MKLFDSQIQPMVLYGAEVWGLDAASLHVEKVHLFALKKFLGVSLKTPNNIVYGETNRYPLKITAALKCIRFWLKLTQMEQHRLPRKAYEMLYQLDERGKLNWVTKVRRKLYESGFGFVWLNQGVENQALFLRTFRDRLIACQWQDWNSHLEDSNRYDMYNLINPSHSIPLYLTMKLDRHMKRIVTKFRFGISELKTHHFYYRQGSERDLICPLCGKTEENEMHFVLVCPWLAELREQFIPKKFTRQPCLNRFIMLITSRNENVVKQLALYLYKAFRLRDTLCNS